MEYQFTTQLEDLIRKHYTEDRKWRYSLEKADFNSLQDLIDRREDCKREDTLIERAEMDTSIRERALAADRKLKRLKMAKFSKELFDEIVEEMMREKKTIMEMLAELDCTETQVYAAQTRLARKQQAKNIGKNVNQKTA